MAEWRGAGGGQRRNALLVQGWVTDGYGGLERLSDGLGFLDASACPHYDAGPERRRVYHGAIAEGLPAGYGVDDGAALHFWGSELVEVVGSTETASAYRVQPLNGRVIESQLPARWLSVGGE